MMHKKLTLTLLLIPGVLISKPKRKQTSDSTTQPTLVRDSLSDIAETPAPKRTVTVNNTLTPDILKYHFMGTDYKPEKITTLVNGEEIKTDEIKKITTLDETVTIECKYVFWNDMYKGGKKVTFKLADATDYKLDFSWNKDERVQLTGASVISFESV